MFPFLTKKNKRPRRTGPPARDPLIAVPQLLSNVELKCDEDGRAQLRREILTKDSVAQWVGKKIGWVRARYFNLDEQGSFFVGQLDGKSDLRTLARRMEERFSLTRSEAEEHVTTFTQLMMMRGLVGIRPDGLPKPKPKPKPKKPGKSNGR